MPSKSILNNSGKPTTFSQRQPGGQRRGLCRALYREKEQTTAALQRLLDLVPEAPYWAIEVGETVVTSAHVYNTLEGKDLRVDMSTNAPISCQSMACPRSTILADG